MKNVIRQLHSYTATQLHSYTATRSFGRYVYILIIPLMTFLSTFPAFSQQILVNKAWEQSFGNPSGIDWSASILDGGGNLITTGNTVISASKIALLVTKQNPDGAILWQKQFTIAAASKNYGVSLATDNSNNIYVAGTCYESDTTGKYNMLVVKFNASGTKLWHKIYNGTGNDDDAAVGIICNASGSEVYVTGPSQGVGAQADYLTLKLKGSGGEISWEQRYNYSANLNDIPIALSFDGSGKIVVAGGSATDALNYDVFTMKYDTSGTFSDSLRVANPGNGYDQPSALFKDNSGNLYVTGSTTTNGTDYDILTIKLNNNLDTVWKRTFDFNGLEDRGTSVNVDASGNVFITGFSTKDTTTVIYTALKYAANGNLVWSNKYGEIGKKSRARKGILDTQGNLTMTGVVKQGTGYSWVTLQYDTDGALNWLIEGEETTGDGDKPTDIKLNLQGGIYISGIKKTGGTVAYTTIRYDDYDRAIAIEYEYEPDTIPVQVSKEIIIRFKPEVLDQQGFIDKKDLLYGDVEDVITDTALIAQMDSVLDTNGSIGRWKLLKIFSFLDSEPVTLTSKSGHPVPLPTLWTALILVLGIEGEVDEQALVHELNKLDGIVYAQVNWISTGMTNDSLYGEQYSLWDNPVSSLYNNANINVEDAWDAGVKGSDEITVAVFDSGIDFRHEDFGYIEGETGYGSSVVNGGWCFLPGIPGIPYSPLSELEVPDVLGHGTNSAGIIGAISNNEKGIAGIAGGDAENDIPGVRLQGMMIINSDNQAYLDYINSAILYSLMNSIPLFDISNNSWGFPEEQDDPNPFPLLREVFRLSYEMGVINVCSRGNEGDNKKRYPSSFRDDWALSVGASGTNGLKVDGSANDGIEIGSPHWSSSYGADMDFVAPGAFLTIKTTGTLNQDEYTGHSGASAAAPHASGVAALVLERLKANYDNFSPSIEDVEHYIEYGATDITDEDGCEDCLVGYEDLHGWGRLNAGAAIDLVDSFKPVHISINPTYVTETVDNFSTAFAYNYNHNYKGIEGMTPIYATDYKMYTAEININVCEDENNLNTGATLANISIEQKHPYWLRNTFTYLWGPPGTDNIGYNWFLMPENNTSITNPAVSEDRCIFTAQLQGYEYIIYDVNTEDYESLPIVPEGESRKFELTLLVSDPENYFGNEIVLTGSNKPVIYPPLVTLIPNPAFEKIQIKGDFDMNSKLKARIINVFGQVLIPEFLIDGSKEVEIDQLPSGIYFFVYESEGVGKALKFIKL